MLITTPDTTLLPAETTAALHAKLADAIGVTAHAIRAVALIWAELESRGEDMSGYRFSLRQYMRGVAAGSILPETVAALAGQRRTLDVVALLPPDRQIDLVNGAEIDIAQPDGQIARKRLSAMTYSEVVRTIRDGRVRTVDEQQIALRRSEATVSSPRSKQGRPPRIVVIDGGVNIKIGTFIIPAERVVSALRAGGVI